ncbi:MAG: universal stress protein UspA [Sphingomonas sp.]|nr:universal stress protein UspA [Sphingomonas sp.]
MKNVLVLLHDDVGQEARFQAALDLARGIGGHLTCVHVTVLPLLAGEYAAVGGSGLLMEDECAREESNRTRIEARLNAEDVPFDWLEETGFLTPSVLDAAALADIVVLNRELDTITYPDMVELVGDTVIRSRKPVLAVPEQTRRLDLFASALIAWDGSPEAEAAMRAAVPLLSLATDVILVEVADGSIRTPAEGAAEYLSRHGINPEIRRRSNAFDIPSSVILDMIDETRAEYLVMGGFGHSRFVEAAFGGVTRRMLKECPVPLFLTH